MFKRIVEVFSPSDISILIFVEINAVTKFQRFPISFRNLETVQDRRIVTTER